MHGNLFRFLLPLLLTPLLVAPSGGCHALLPHPEYHLPPGPDWAESAAWTPPIAPRESDKVILPTYVIEPPDVLSVDAINVVPKSPYRLRTMDTVVLQVTGTLPEAPIEGEFPIEAGGVVRLGFNYGSVTIAGLSTQEAEEAIETHLRQYLREPQVTLALGTIVGKQQIAGEHIVGPDGTITLGTYGSVLVVGKTLSEAKEAIEQHLSRFLEDPEVSVKIFSYNSKVYYVITQGAGMGDQVARFPIMGNETVLDAISQIQGLTQVSSKRIWVARPGKDFQGQDQIMPVDWLAITQRGNRATNYQLLPNDRLYVAEDKWIALDSSLAKVTAPLERIMGFTLLGVGTVSRFSGPVLRGGGTRGVFGGF